MKDSSNEESFMLMLAMWTIKILDISMDTKGLKLVEDITSGEISHNSVSGNAIRYFFLRSNMDVIETIGALARAGLMARNEETSQLNKPLLQFRGYAIIPPAKVGFAPRFDESRLLFEDLSVDEA